MPFSIVSDSVNSTTADGPEKSDVAILANGRIVIL
jgi:hypothetical protein